MNDCPRRRLRLKKTELSILNSVFEENNRPNKYVLSHLSDKFGVSIRYLSRWFQNKRTREKRRRIIMNEDYRDALDHPRDDNPMGKTNLGIGIQEYEFTGIEEIPLSPNPFGETSDSSGMLTSSSLNYSLPPSLAHSAATMNGSPVFGSNSPSLARSTIQTKTYMPELLEPQQDMQNGQNYNINFPEHLRMVDELAGLISIDFQANMMSPESNTPISNPVSTYRNINNSINFLFHNHNLVTMNTRRNLNHELLMPVRKKHSSDIYNNINMDRRMNAGGGFVDNHNLMTFTNNNLVVTPPFARDNGMLGHQRINIPERPSDFS